MYKKQAKKEFTNISKSLWKCIVTLSGVKISIDTLHQLNDLYYSQMIDDEITKIQTTLFEMSDYNSKKFKELKKEGRL